jgi:hypothetical protein
LREVKRRSNLKRLLCYARNDNYVNAIDLRELG